MLFIIIGVYLAAEQGLEKRVGRELEKAAPVARKIIPLPAKRILSEGRQLLPIYGPTGQWLARKGASIVYFGVVGVFVLALRRRKATSLGEILVVTTVAAVAMSAIIEIFELPEELPDQIFDLLCGALGGLVFGFLAWWWRRKQSAIGAA